MNRRPAEWEPIDAVWLAWPHNADTWPQPKALEPKALEPRASSESPWLDRVVDFYVDWVEAICRSHPVRILAIDPVASQCDRRLRHRGVAASRFELIPIATNDCWIRDYAPQWVFGEGNRLSAVNFGYNAWGGKYPPYDLDAAAGGKIARHLNVPVSRSPLILEGGAVEADGNGRALINPQCVITPTRNDDRWTTDTVAQHLHQTLGLTEIGWMDECGIAGDDTDGHIDQLARFIDPHNVVVATADASSPDHANTRSVATQLKLWADITKPSVMMHPVPMPAPRQIDGRAVPQSYMNFHRLGADRILVPTFGDPNDDTALQTLSRLTSVSAEPLDCRDIIWGLGGPHCASMEQPAPQSAP